MRMTSSMSSTDTAALVTLGSQRQTIRGETPDDVRSSIISTAQAWASAHDQTVILESTEGPNQWTVQVGPDGSLTEVDPDPLTVLRQHGIPVPSPSSTSVVAPTDDDQVTEPLPPVTENGRDAAFQAEWSGDSHNPTQPTGSPSSATSPLIEVATLDALASPPPLPQPMVASSDRNPFRQARSHPNGRLKQSGTVRVMVANTSGGAGKTPTLIGVALAMAQQRGGELVMVDLNPTGNLGEMAGVGHEAPLPDIIAWLATTPEPTRAQLQTHLAWSVKLGCWIVTSREAVTGPDGAPLDTPGPTGEQTRRVLAVLGEQFGLIGMDTGNNDLDWSYRAAAEVADCLLVASNGTAKAHAGALATVADLWDLGYQSLAGQAVVVNVAPRIRLPGMNNRRRSLDELGLRVVDVPFDRQIAGMRPDRMGRAAQAAYARAADIVAVTQ